jgi:drug/metabolite transporter (DMT)-like permease
MWLIVAILGYLMLAVVNILDKGIVTERVRPLVFVFYAGIFSLPLFLILPWTGFIFSLPDLGIALFSGFMFLAALLAMYHGFQKTEISHSAPLVGASTALCVLILSRFFLGEVLTAVQFIAIALIIVGSVLISFQKTKKTSGFSRALLFALLSGLLFAFSHISAKYTYDHYHFWTGTVWTKGIMGVYALLLLLVPSVRKSVFKKSSKKVSHTHSSLVVVIANRILSILGTGLTQYAVALGSVSVVNALQGVQYAVLVILVLILTRFFPKVFREFYTRSEVILELIAVVVVAIGLVLLVK